VSAGGAVCGGLPLLRALRAVDGSSFAVLLRRMDGFARQALRVTSYSSSYSYSILPLLQPPEAPRHTPHALSRTSSSSRAKRDRLPQAAQGVREANATRTRTSRSRRRTHVRCYERNSERRTENSEPEGGLTSAATIKQPSTGANNCKPSPTACLTILPTQPRTPRSSPRRCGRSSTA
jgi:hypothetical protein